MAVVGNNLTLQHPLLHNGCPLVCLFVYCFTFLYCFLFFDIYFDIHGVKSLLSLNAGGSTLCPINLLLILLVIGTLSYFAVGYPLLLHRLCGSLSSWVPSLSSLPLPLGHLHSGHINSLLLCLQVGAQLRLKVPLFFFCDTIRRSTLLLPCFGKGLVCSALALL